MTIDISDAAFRKLFDDKELYLPIRWDGSDFAATLDRQYSHYIKQLEIFSAEKAYRQGCAQVNIAEVKKVCGLLARSVDHYMNGFPSNAYESFTQAMYLLMKKPLLGYQRSVLEQFEGSDNGHGNGNELKLFRAVKVDDNKPYQRTRVFHTPYNLRSKVSTSRYSIAGYPSLYLGTSLALCCEEIHMNPHQDFALASMFKLEETPEFTSANIQVIELGIKPQDFINPERANEHLARHVNRNLLESEKTRSAYLLWYPLIASCSYIRTNKNDPFAAEYIIPQLLMQWVRNEIDIDSVDEYNNLVGIRYFSCASIKASDMGFNYVFPTSGQQKSSDLPFCSVLYKVFRLTKPEYIHESDDMIDCERRLRRATDFDYVGII